MKLNDLKILVLGAITMIAVSSCRSTVNGVVSDTERNTHKVGKGVEHVGEKIQEKTR